MLIIIQIEEKRVTKMEASMQVTQAAAGEKAFFRTNNGGYGTSWEAGQTSDPNEVPQYRELVSICFLTSLT